MLLDLMVELKSRMGIEIAVAHINHRLRGNESEEDEKFVKSLQTAMDSSVSSIALTRVHLSSSTKTSLQAGAREIRYKFLETVRRS